MTVTLEEMVETFCEAHFGDGGEPWLDFAKRLPALANSHRDDASRGLRAVLDKHVREMLADCRAETIADVQRQMRVKPMPTIDSPETYADRILKSVKGE